MPEHTRSPRCSGLRFSHTLILMNSLLPFILVATSVLFSACSEPGSPIDPEPPAPSSEQDAIDGEEQAVASGRANIVIIDRHTQLRNREGIMRVQRTITFPQFVGKEPGLDRINGFLRYLALDWPSLPQQGRSSPSDSAEVMYSIGGLASALGPEEWPTITQVESLAGLFPGEFLTEEFYPTHDESSFTVTIVRMDVANVTLHFEVFDASGAATRGNEGELTFDLHSGEAISLP